MPYGRQILDQIASDRQVAERSLAAEARRADTARPQFGGSSHGLRIKLVIFSALVVLGNLAFAAEAFAARNHP